MSDDDDIKKAIEKLELITKDLSEEDKQKAKILFEYLKLLKNSQDYAGIQTFPIEDYKRRN